MSDFLLKIQKDLLGCVKCELCKFRTSIVFGEGNPQAKLMFIGEAPGKEEDKAGRPFVGNAGKLLTKMIHSMHLKREDVYICNIIKCRPPLNRRPTVVEILACIPVLIKQIDSIKPEVIVTLGACAYQSLFNSIESISKVAGIWKVYQGISVMPTYHPSFLLRCPKFKKYVWRDLKLVMDKLRGDI
ncbi:MAG: uracil-DNA glycosylase [Deltaproteobacteria bacterium]|nr:MAG: uracil-DNA glycosylase [Deltaproteobacteria bacterium]